jgi:hypothetical protein
MPTLFVVVANSNLSTSLVGNSFNIRGSIMAKIRPHCLHATRLWRIHTILSHINMGRNLYSCDLQYFPASVNTLDMTHTNKWKSSSLVYETSNPRDKHAGELFSAILRLAHQGFYRFSAIPGVKKSQGPSDTNTSPALKVQYSTV